MNDKIPLSKIKKYILLTEESLKAIKEKKNSLKEKEAREIIDMASNYLEDAKHFLDKKDYVNSFAAINYAYGWIDCGARLGIFNVEDGSKFTLP